MEKWLIRAATSSARDGASGGGANVVGDGGEKVDGKKRRLASIFIPKPKKPRPSLGECRGNPATICAWNVNGIKNRLLYHKERINKFMQERKPDLLFLSELKLRAAGSKSGFAIKRSELSLEDKTSVEESRIMHEALATCFKGYQIRYSLSSKRYSGTAILWKEGLQPLNIWFTLPDVENFGDRAIAKDKKVHHDDGRINLVEWQDFITLHTYSPNNGSSEKSFSRRREWDAYITSWLEKACCSLKKPIIYIGDLNCAPGDEDLSHPKWFAGQFPASTPGDSGQPGCTPNEQARFLKMLQAGQLVDVYRHLNTKPSNASLEGPYYTWRGTPGQPPLEPEAGKYYTRGMRIDHVLASHSIRDRFKSVSILGTGISCKDPSFLGSDHCPIWAELASPSSSSSSSIADDNQPRST